MTLAPNLSHQRATLTVASYNIHKAIGLDRQRDPERILTVLRELAADVIALQEADLRFGTRQSAIPRAMIEEYSDYVAVPFDTRPGSIGWHGNALLVRRHMVDIVAARPIRLPTLEPRGAVLADLIVRGQPVRVVGMHLDLSGIRRRQQVRTILAQVAENAPGGPVILMGDLNEWSLHGGCIRDFTPGYAVLAPGRSFHTRRPVAQLDRIIVSDGVGVVACGVHHSPASSRASDHLPVWAHLTP